MNIKDSVVLVTGANRGLGLALIKALKLAGARKIYAAARDPSTITLPGVLAIKLDVTNAADIAAAVQAAPDLTILINNAGIMLNSSTVDADAATKARAEMDANFFAPMALSSAFAPVLKSNGGGAIVNVLSVLSWLSLPGSATYSASKAAAWAMTNGLRGDLYAQGTQVLGAHMGLMDTDMAKGVDMDKTHPDLIAKEILTALEANQDEVLTDETSRQVKAGIGMERSFYLGQPRA
ncbi:SDR family oxidoreductase [Rugamonas sp.]|uniref:SDR family oxidoreductase n=1 Tax=Rugamonas sp. TaxID=1926287 RepID=UPI0025D5517E|nr:SDR family oxidoreductase [Rugamonas sp.]